MLIQSPTRTYRNWVADSRRWNAYRPRTGDIVIATYPKSGTTWMQQIVSLLVFLSPEPRAVAEISPWLDRRHESLDALLQRLEVQAHRRFLKSHVPFDGMPIHDDVKYIHVARDGRDACLSYHNHNLAYAEARLADFDAVGLADETLGQPFPRPPADAREYFRRWLREGLAGETDGLPFGSWFNCERTWWADRHRPNLLMVHYRDLKTDLAGEMRRVAEFLDIAVPEPLWPTLVEAATFAAMRRNGDMLQPALRGGLIGGSATFFHKGENGRWRGVLTDDDIAAYEARVRERLEPDCAAWLQAGRLGSL